MSAASYFMFSREIFPGVFVSTSELWMCGARELAGRRGSKVPVGTSSSFSVWENWIFFFLLSGFVSIFPTFIVCSAVQAQIAKATPSRMATHRSRCCVPAIRGSYVVPPDPTT